MKTFDDFSTYYEDFLDGTYDCIDRIVLNAYFIMAQSNGGFRTWCRRLAGGGDENLDNMHLMRFAGRFARRVRAYANKNGIPLIHCQRGERKHEIAQQYLPKDTTFRGLSYILVGRAPGAVRYVRHYGNSGIDIRKKEPQPYVNHYSFHIIDDDWGHITIKLYPHPPFNAQIMLNGHEYVAAQARKENISFTKEGDFFTSPYELKKLRGKGLVCLIAHSRRYEATGDGLRAMTGCLILREKVLRPLLANTGQRKRGRKPKTGCTIDTHYENIQIELQKIFKIIGIAA